MTDNTSTENNNQLTLVRIYHHHQFTPTFHRRISYVMKVKQSNMLLYNISLVMAMKFLLFYCHMVMLREFSVPTVIHRRVHSLVVVKYLEIVDRYIIFNIHCCHIAVLAQVGNLILNLNCFNIAKWIICLEVVSS